MPVIKIEQLADEVSKLCKAHVDEIGKETKSAVQGAGKACVEDLRMYPSKRGFGKYGNSWVATLEGSMLTGYSVTVHSTMPGLPHLIEFGHGGPAPAPPHPHLDKAFEAGRKVFMEKLGR